MKIYCKLLFLAVFVLLWTGCATIKPDKPDLPVSPTNVPPLPVSNIDIPVTVNLQPLYKQIEENMPRDMTNGGYPNWSPTEDCRVEFRWHFWRSILNFAATGNTLQIGSTGYYSGEGHVRPCCGWTCFWSTVGCGTKNMGGAIEDKLLKEGFSQNQIYSFDKLIRPENMFISINDNPVATKEPPRQIQIGLSSSFQLLKNYQLSSETKLSAFNPINRCQITFLNIDITDKILGVARGPINNACNSFDKKISEINIKNRVEPVWNKLSQPFEITGYGYLTVNPTAIRFGNMNANRNNLDFAIGLSANPEITLQQPNPKPIPLPDISDQPPGHGFNVIEDSKLQYAPLSDILNSSADIVGRRIDLDDKHYIEIKKVSLYGVGNEKLIMKIDFKGSAKGRLYLTGTPVYDPSTKLISFPDLDYDIKTKNILVEVASWLLKPKLTQLLRDRAKWNISQKLDDLKTTLQKGLTRDFGNGISSTGSIDSLEALLFNAQSDYLLLRLGISGQLRLNIAGR